jgi:hypothetical protein
MAETWFRDSEAESVNKDAAPQPRSGGDTGVNLLVGVRQIERPTSCSQSGGELARLTPQVDMELGGKTRELSRRLVEKALAGRADERWQEFLQIVQASELSSLANTLDNDLATFIKQVLD